MLIKADTLLTIEQGEYSDRSWDGPFRVLKDFDQAAVSEEYRAQFKPDPNELEDEPNPRNFVAWLATSGYVEDVQVSLSWHVGCYGRFEPEIYKDN